MFETKVDQLVSFLQKKRSVGIDQLAHHLSLSAQTVEMMCAVLEKGGLLDINYPLDITKKPTVVFRLMPAEPPRAEEQVAKGKAISNYTFIADGVPASVAITDSEKEKIYTITLVDVGTASKIFLDLIKEELLRAMPAGIQSDVSDIEKAAAAREQFSQYIRKYLAQFQLGKESEDMLGGLLLHKLFGLGEIDMLNHDDWLEDIIINNAREPIGVYHRKFGWLKSNLYMPDEEPIFNYASQIGRRVGRQIATLTT